MNFLVESMKLVSVIILIIIMLKLKWDLGLTMFLASISLSFLFQIGFKGLLDNFYHTIMDLTTLKLIGIVVLVYFLSGILKRTKSMEGFVYPLQYLVTDYRLVLFLIASLLGLIPMPAGAMFSAPLLKEIGEENDLDSEAIMMSNYWFRHVWEFFWPLIPGVVLYVAVIGVSFREIMIMQFPLSIFALFIGFFWMYRNLEKIDNHKISNNTYKKYLLVFLNSVWPILLIISLVLFFKIDLLISLGLTILLLLIVKKISARSLREIVIHDLSGKIVIMIIGIMLFKQVLNSTNSLTLIALFLSETGINIWIILFFIPFLLGFLTGIITGFIGVGFPIILPLMLKDGSVNLSMAMFAYLGGFTGMMISPVHLCLTLTLEYLKVNVYQFYKKLYLNLFIFIVISTIYIILFNS